MWVWEKLHVLLCAPEMLYIMDTLDRCENTFGLDNRVLIDLATLLSCPSRVLLYSTYSGQVMM